MEMGPWLSRQKKAAPAITNTARTERIDSTDVFSIVSRTLTYFKLRPTVFCQSRTHLGESWFILSLKSLQTKL
jgi:hypothetical protein